MLYLIKTDLHRHSGLKGAMGFVRGWFQPGFRYTFIFRIVSKTHNPVLKFFFRLLKRTYRIKYGYEIDSRARIGEGFFLSDHCGPTIIGNTTIGKNCNISHCVTIGRSFKNGVVGVPTIGDRVWIGSGSSIVGKITIGSNVLIAPNSYVNIDVPSNSLVVGNPATIFPKENPTKYYIHYILGEPDNNMPVHLDSKVAEMQL
jgi:serine O-acetyltransferase